MVCLLVPEIHLHGLEDVRQEDERQHDLDERDQWVAREGVRVVVEGRRSKEDQRVPGNVRKKEQEQGKAGDADEQLGADGRGKDANSRRHQPQSLPQVKATGASPGARDMAAFVAWPDGVIAPTWALTKPNLGT